MILYDMIARVRRLARLTTTSHSDDDIRKSINDGQREFAKDVHGMVKHNYLKIVPKFYTDSHFAFRVTTASASADIPLGEHMGATGATLASEIEASVSTTWGDCSLSWNSSTWKFYMEITGSTTITIGAPSGDYADASGLIFGGACAVASATIVGTMPDECTLETDLPTDFLKIYYAEWDNNSLTPFPYDGFMSPEETGTPCFYTVKNKLIRLTPEPTSQKSFHILYKWCPTDFGTVATASSSGSISASSALDSNYQIAPIYHAVFTNWQEQLDSERSKQFFGLYREQVIKYNIEQNNQNPQMFPRATLYKEPIVTLP